MNVDWIQENLPDHVAACDWQGEHVMWLEQTEQGGEMPPATLFRDLPFERYADIPAVNSGMLKWGNQSGWHLYRAMVGKLKLDDRPSFVVGRAIHCALLEPQNWQEQFVTAGQCEAITNAGKPTERRCESPGKSRSDGEWFCGRHNKGKPLDDIPEGNIVSQEVRDNCTAMVEAIGRTEIKNLLHLDTAWHECTIVWWQKVSIERDGAFRVAWVLCKSRSDRLSLEAQPKPINLDLKTSQVGEADDFSISRKIEKYGWHFQQAHYSRGIHNLCGRWPVPVLLVVESAEPFSANPTPLDSATMKVADGLWRAAMRKLVRGLLFDEWPGVFDPKTMNHLSETGGVVPSGLSEWALKRWLGVYLEEEDLLTEKRGRVRNLEERR